MFENLPRHAIGDPRAACFDDDRIVSQKQTSTGCGSKPFSVISLLKTPPVIDRSLRSFEKFGISGHGIVYSDRGPIRLIDVREDDRVLTRSAGLKAVKIMMTYKPLPSAHKLPEALKLCDGAMGEGLPQGDLVVGRQSVVTRHVIKKQGRQRTTPLTLDLAEIENCHFWNSSESETLCIPVFAKPTQLLVQGLSILCPSITDVKRE